MPIVRVEEHDPPLTWVMTSRWNVNFSPRKPKNMLAVDWIK